MKTPSVPGMQQPERDERPWVIGLMAVLAFLCVHPIFQDLHRWGIQDWDLNFFFYGAPLTTILEHGQVPLWNPWFCGGMPMLAGAEFPCLSPILLVPMVFGVVVGLKILVGLHLFAGLLGTYCLARVWGQRPLAAFLAACVFMLSSCFGLHLVVGQTWAWNMAWVPWVVWCYVRAVGAPERPEFVVGAAAFLVLMWFGGGPYILAMTLLFLVVHGAAVALAREQGFGRTVRVVAGIVGLMLCLGAVKFLPSIAFSLEYPRIQDLQTGISFDALVHGLFSRDQGLESVKRLAGDGGFWRGATHGMHEFGMYVGVVAFALAGVGAVVLARRRLSVLICLCIFLWLAFGVRAPWSAWAWLHEVPGFNIMRVAERFNIVVLLCVAICAGEGCAWWLRREWAGRWARWGAGLVVALVVVDLVSVAMPLYRRAFTINPVSLPFQFHGKFVQTPERYLIGPEGWAQDDAEILDYAWSSHYPALLDNQGILMGYDESPSPRRAVPYDDAGYRGEVFLFGTAGEAQYRRWTPNRLTIAVEAAGEGYFVVNQNYYRGWHVRGGGRVVERVGGLLGVKVGRADREVEIFYRPLSVVIGAWISVVTVAGLVCGWMRVRRRR